MIVYHGTTRRAARRIARDGFQPRSPSRRVWLSRSKSYAKQRAHAKARHTRDRPIVLTVDIDLKTLRQRYGSRQVRESGGVISIRGDIPRVLAAQPLRAGTPGDGRGDRPLGQRRLGRQSAQRRQCPQ